MSEISEAMERLERAVNNVVRACNGEPEEAEHNRLYIRIFVDYEPQEKAEKLYQICSSKELLEIAEHLKEYAEAKSEEEED